MQLIRVSAIIYNSLQKILPTMRYTALALVLSTAGISGPAYACKCMPSLFTQIKEQESRASQIFIGIPTTVKTDGIKMITKFKVLHAIKGNADAKLVHTVSDTDSCGFIFKKDTRYLVFANTEDVSSHYVADACNGTIEEASPFYIKRVKQIKALKGF